MQKTGNFPGCHGKNDWKSRGQHQKISKYNFKKPSSLNYRATQRFDFLHSLKVCTHCSDLIYVGRLVTSQKKCHCILSLLHFWILFPFGFVFYTHAELKLWNFTIKDKVLTKYLPTPSFYRMLFWLIWCSPTK